MNIVQVYLKRSLSLLFLTPLWIFINQILSNDIEIIEKNYYLLSLNVEI